jgi:hypothetical protein
MGGVFKNVWFFSRILFFLLESFYRKKDFITECVIDMCTYNFFDFMNTPIFRIFEQKFNLWQLMIP